MKVLIIDSHNMLHRARFGFGDGEHKVYFNFFRMLMGEMKRHEPDIVYIVDEGSPTQSLELMEEYKGNRVRLDDPSFHREKAEVFETIKHVSGFVYIQHPDFEADDVIALVATDLHPRDEVVIVSSDSDFIQLISERVNLWDARKKIFTPDWDCGNYIVWKALRGDPTDNVPGVKGVGQKTADQLCRGTDTALNEFLDAKDGRRKDFETSYAVIKLKNVPSSGLQVVQSDFLVDSLFEEFSKRKFKSIIGKAWSGWIEAFSRAGGKYGS
jgi:5'-3' exonuclease